LPLDRLIPESVEEIQFLSMEEEPEIDCNTELEVELDAAA